MSNIAAHGAPVNAAGRTAFPGALPFSNLIFSSVSPYSDNTAAKIHDDVQLIIGVLLCSPRSRGR